MAPELEANGLLTIPNREPLAVLCNCYGDYRECIEAIKKEGKIVKSPTGVLKPHPLVGMSKQYAELYGKLSGEFGLTPSTKSKVVIEPRGEVDPLNEFLGEAQ